MRSLSGSCARSFDALAAGALGADLNDISLLKQQMAREISSLEAQLFRLRTRDDLIDYSTLQTYEDMIASRRRLLDGLLWDE